MNELKDNEITFLETGVDIIYISTVWCPPCKIYKPIIEDISKEYEKNPNIKFSKIDAEHNRELAIELGVSGVPTTIFFKDGEEKERKVGMMQKNQVKQIIEKYA